MLVKFIHLSTRNNILRREVTRFSLWKLIQILSSYLKNLNLPLEWTLDTTIQSIKLVEGALSASYFYCCLITVNTVYRLSNKRNDRIRPVDKSTSFVRVTHTHQTVSTLPLRPCAQSEVTASSEREAARARELTAAAQWREQCEFLREELRRLQMGAVAASAQVEQEIKAVQPIVEEPPETA